MVWIDYFLSSSRLKKYLSKEKIKFNDKNIQKKLKKASCRILIDDQITYQTIIGIGYSFEHSSCSNFLKLSQISLENAIKLLVHPQNGAGLNLWRICIGTSDFSGTKWYSYDDIPNKKEDLELEKFTIEKDKRFIIPILKLALKINPEIFIFASPWSPPAWMKDSRNLCGGRLLRKYYKVYADYFVNFIKEYGKIDIPIFAVTVQNEPGVNNNKMPSCKWTPEEERDFIRDFLGPAFKKANLKTKIWCYDHNFGFLRKPTKYPETVLNDDNAAKYIDGVAFHHYGGIPEFMRLIQNKFPKKHLYFTEGSIFGLRGARNLARYFRNGVRSYNGWVPFIDTERKPNNGPHRCNRTILQLQVPENKVLINFDYYLLTHYSKFLQRGAYRIYSKIKKSRKVSQVTFLNPDQSIITIITNLSLREKKIKIEWRNKFALINLPRKSIATLRWFSQ